VDILFLFSYTCVNPPEFKIMGNKNDGYLYDRFELAPNDWVDYRKGWDAIETELINKFPKEAVGIKFSKINKKILYLFVFLGN